MGSSGFYLPAGLLALLTSILGVNAWNASQYNQPTNAPVMFMIGFTGLVIVMAIDSVSKRDRYHDQP